MSYPPKFDPIKMFRVAEEFRQAGGLCTTHMSAERFDGERYHFLCPAAVLDVFSLEIYLKCLYVLEKHSEPKPTHDLVKLFRKISKPAQAEIRRRYENASDKEKELREAFFAKIGKSYSFDEILKEDRDAFEVIRYRYEHDKWSFLIGSVCEPTRLTILYRHPECAPQVIADTPETNPYPIWSSP